MNQRVKQLYKKARGLTLSTNDFVLEEWEKKFAELIVKECFTKLTPYIDECSINDVKAELKEHFGIKQ